jgi:hypothetical protein
VVMDATLTAATNSVEDPGSEEGEDSSLPPGLFTLATVEGGRRESASAITLALPGMCLTSDVSSARYDSWRCTCGVHGSNILCRACVSGLWSDRMYNFLPSNIYWNTEH